MASERIVAIQSFDVYSDCFLIGVICKETFQQVTF
jgi:hypothetical protein